MMRRLFSLVWGGQARLAPVQRQVSVHGLRLGVRSNGAAFVSDDSAARLCGFASAASLEAAFARPVAAAGKPTILDRGGLTLRVYDARTCVSLIEAVAREASLSDRYARHNSGLLSAARLEDLARDQTGFVPAGALPDQERRLHAHVTLIYNYAPKGRFSPVKELCDLVIHAGRHRGPVRASPSDLFAAAKLWGDQWQDQEFDRRFEPRTLYLNAYPASLLDRENPARPYCYPAGALAEFRAWLAGTAPALPWLEPLASAWPLSMAELAIHPGPALSGVA